MADRRSRSQSSSRPSWRTGAGLLMLAGYLVFVFAAPASAHNTLVTSDPVDGAVLDGAEQVRLVFAKDVPLVTVSVEVIRPDGVRQDLSGVRHGPAGATEVVADLPPLDDGAVRLRWRLVGPDGHAITGRVSFTLSGGAPAAAASEPPPEPTPFPTTAPSWLRWALRFSSYLAVAAIVGTFVSTLLVWPRAWEAPHVRAAVGIALGFGASGALAQLLVIGGDIAGTQPWDTAAASQVGASLQTDAGKALVLRIVLLGAVAGTAFGWRAPLRVRLAVATALTTLALATWAFAGHARTMRMPLLGVPVDVVHHAAAAVWLGGLALLGLGLRWRAQPEELVLAAKRFAPVAAWSVTLLVATGVVQTIRLTDEPVRLLTGAHGRLLIGKLVVLGAMLKVADINRRRVTLRLASAEGSSVGVVRALGRAMRTEMVVGLGIVGITSLLVVTPPAIADESFRPSSMKRGPHADPDATTTYSRSTTAFRKMGVT